MNLIHKRTVSAASSLFLATVFLTAQQTEAAITYGSLTGTTYSQNFNAITTSPTAAVPTGWGFGALNTVSTAVTTTSQNAGTTGTGVIASGATGGDFLFVNGVLASGTDKALGYLTQTGQAKDRSIFLGLTNNTGTLLTGFTLDWNYEKYRNGTKLVDWQFSYSVNGGVTFTPIATGNQSYIADADSTTVYNPPNQISANGASPVSISGLSLANGGNVTFQWYYNGSNGNNQGQGLAIDDFTLTAVVPEPSTWMGGSLLLGLIAWAGYQKRRTLAV
jgi:hypothetical protein